MSLVATSDFNSELWRDRPAVSVSAGALRKSMSTLKIHNDESISLGWRTDLKNRIVEAAEECAIQGWDGEDAAPITLTTKIVAEQFVELLPDAVTHPTVVPDNQGSFSFDWFFNRDLVLSISILEGRAIFAGVFGDKKLHGEAQIQDEMPGEISTILEKYFRRSE